MKRNGPTVRYTAEELEEMIARGESQTDWERVRSLTQDEIEAAIASDPDEAEMVIDWSNIVIGIPAGPKEQLTLRLDPEVVDWFRATGKGYQTRINAVLKGYVESKKAS